jgi:UPF0176 protein
MTSVSNVLNISAYRFVELDDIEALRARCLNRTRELGLKGTILLAAEGINLFLAGPAEAVRGFIAELREDTRFEALVPKESWSSKQPFRKMLVKIKREIIRMDHPAIRPQAGRAPAVSSHTLRRWLDQGHDDEGREVVTLDTRNAFEVDHGRFDGAIDWRINRFGEFPRAAREHLPTLQGKTVVSYCTGGIRCEKAAIYLREIGLPTIYQLEGGILKYFEETGGAHFKGGCFVFDEREVLQSDLQPGKSANDRQGPDDRI